VTKLSLPKSGLLPALLSSKALVKERQNLRYIKLYIFKIEVLLTVLLHLEKIVQFEIEFKKPAIPPYKNVSTINN
jgi:hypothetical protein